jgi:hypothetical protein
MMNGEEVEVLDRSPVPADLAAKIQAQLEKAGPEGTADGPLTDINSLYRPTTYAELTQYLGALPASEAPDSGVIPEVKPASELSVAAVTKQESFTASVKEIAQAAVTSADAEIARHKQDRERLKALAGAAT